MEFQFRLLELPPLPQPKVQELINLANGTGGSALLAPPELPLGVPKYQATMPRSLDEILADIENRTGEKVTILEWVYLFYSKEDWDKQQGSDRAKSTSQAIWQFAQYNPVIKFRLFWRLALFYGSKSQDIKVFPPSLADAFPEFVSQFKESDSLTVDILSALAEYTISLKTFKLRNTITYICFEELLTPKQLLKKAKLPPDVYPMDVGAFRAMIREFNAQNNPNRQQANLLINCLEEMSEKPQLHGVEYLLTKVPKEIAGQFSILVNWVQQHYGITSPDTRWSELSQEAKTALKDWLGALGYLDFVTLVKILLDKLDLRDWEWNQLKRRREFWSNYSDRFERIRILLPQSSQKVIKEAIGSEFEHQDISILEEDGSEPTEVCIFDFGDCCIVEFFRGTGSETRLFNAQDYPDIKTKLFESPTLSLKRLRCLGGEVHDHTFLWQGYCEKLLRNRNIYPNKGTKYFKGLDFPHNQYNRETGLPDPSFSEKEERQRKLKRWEIEMEKIQREADLFCR